MNNSYNKIDYVNKHNIFDSLLEFMSNNKMTNMLLDFSSKKNYTDFLEYPKNEDVVELDKVKNISQEIRGRIILLTYIGKIEKLHFYADKLNIITHYKIIDFQKATDSTLINLKFQWKFFNIFSLNFVSIMQCIEDFIETYFENFKSEKPLFLFSSRHDINRIKKDIEYLKYSAVLTSRLAIFIYKICTWDFNISSTKVGKKFALHYNKSRIYNNKKFDIKNTKGYLIYTMHDYRIMEERIRIVKHLLYNNANCNLYTLSEATNIPLNQLEVL